MEKQTELFCSKVTAGREGNVHEVVSKWVV
jgi:hypothetical protein